MKHVLARGYIKKSKDITNNKSVTNRFAAYTGELRFDSKNILVEVFTDNENFKNKELFVKLSVDTGVNIENML
tara:strand:- start:759 stop:977 length:219 start_codon:yes stop_codon:yes gene_type:complete